MGSLLVQHQCITLAVADYVSGIFFCFSAGCGFHRSSARPRHPRSYVIFVTFTLDVKGSILGPYNYLEGALVFSGFAFVSVHSSSVAFGID